MTEKKDDPYKEPEITVTDAVPAVADNNAPPIPAGHSRFYCSKCHAVRGRIIGVVVVYYHYIPKRNSQNLHIFTHLHTQTCYNTAI
jgi:hypothetical protein